MRVIARAMYLVWLSSLKRVFTLLVVLSSTPD